MASVHESLYFNPMMTNGVVHANVFGIKDWVTPYKISVLVLLSEMTKNTEVTVVEKRRLNKQILPLLQVIAACCTMATGVSYPHSGVVSVYSMTATCQIYNS